LNAFASINQVFHADLPGIGVIPAVAGFGFMTLGDDIMHDLTGGVIV